MKLGMIVRMDKTGLGHQTHELAKMLKPDKLLIIDSRPFKDGTEQFPQWYNDFKVKTITSRGFPTAREKRWFLMGIDTIFTCEIPYGYDLLVEAKRRRINSYIQYNYEFLDYLHQKNLPKPTGFIAPSSWGIEKVREELGIEPILLRPPISTDEFDEVREVNRNRTGKRRFLHIQGIKAVHDRNGTETVIEALQHTKEDFELVIKFQGAPENLSTDPRVIYDNSDPDNKAELYRDFDAILMPRRYGGLCLPMNEALASGLPVIMPDISPNGDLLPSRWLIPARKTSEFMTRTMIDIYTSDAKALAKTIDNMVKKEYNSLQNEKDFAFSIAEDNLSSNQLSSKYREVLGGVS